jgi:hypothetical protein
MSVKYFHSAMTDAPVLNGLAGSLIGLLDACLINGFQLKSVDSIVVVSNVATAEISAGHTYEVDSVVLIAGATPAGLNGEKRVLSASGTQITFAAPGISDQTATGTINARFAPAGWEKPFSGTNLAVYRSPNLAGTRSFLRIDDSVAQNGRAIGYENMTDVNTGTGPFPTTAQVSGGLFWPNANSTAATARTWLVIADDRTFYVWVNTGTTGVLGEGFLYGFGDFASNKGGDAYSCFISGPTTDLSASTAASAITLGYSDLAGDNNAMGFYVARSFTALGGSAAVSRKAESYTTADAYSGNTASVGYPNATDNALLLSRMLITEVTPLTMRGVMRGLYFVPQALGAGTFSTRTKIDGQGPLAGRKLMAVNNSGAPAGTTTTQATSFLDIAGPW